MIALKNMAADHQTHNTLPPCSIAFTQHVSITLAIALIMTLLAGLLISLRVLDWGVVLLADNYLVAGMDNVFMQQCLAMSILSRRSCLS